MAPYWTRTKLVVAWWAYTCRRYLDLVVVAGGSTLPSPTIAREAAIEAAGLQ